MAKERRSLQDRIRDRQQSAFVGRQGQVIQYQDNLGFAVDDVRRRFLFNIHGDAGVGKTYLTRQFQQIAASNGALTAYIDETVEDVTSAMTVIAKEFGRSGVKLADFEKRAAKYWQRRHELESDPQAPDGLASFITKTAVTIGLAAARDIPVAGSLLAPVDAAVAADQVDRARAYLTRKFRDHADVRLLLSPADELTPVFVAGLNRAATGRNVAWFFDTYERTGVPLDHWLRGLYAGRYGDISETLITTISGQKPLNPNLWGDYLSVMADIPLEPFSDAEARQFLASKTITDEATIQVILSLSGRLPLWLATLAEARPHDNADIGDPAGNAVERFLKWEDDPARREIAVTAALPRFLNQDVLTVFTPADKARELFSWLRGLPFVSQRAGSWAYHDVVRAAMLRLRRAEAPTKWRSDQIALARTNTDWANEAAKGIDDTWTNADWIDYTREETYHLLCADPIKNLPIALASAVKAGEHSTIRARQWATLITDAGRDTDHPALKQWGQRLVAGIHDSSLAQYFTCLINDAQLDKTTLIVALEERGEGHRIAGRHDEALADFNRAIEHSPHYRRAIVSRGETYRRMGRFDDALDDFSRAIELDPDHVWAIASRGETYRRMRHFNHALADFSRAIELNPRYDWAIAHRGETYRQMGRFDDALDDFSRAIELDPDHVWAIASRGRTYQAMERDDEALADFSRAIELNPDYRRAIASRGEIYRQMGRFDEALADLNRAIELNPRYDWAIASRGETYRQMGRFDEALADLNRAIKLNPRYDWAIASRGETYRQMGRFNEALVDLNRAIKLNPNSALFFIRRGQTYEAMGRHDDALTDFNRAADLSTTDEGGTGK